MMKKSIVFFQFLLLLCADEIFAQKFKTQFDALFSKKDTIKMKPLLADWEKSDVKDPELYVAYFNYYALKARSQHLSLSTESNGEEALQIMSQDTSQKEPEGFLSGETSYNPTLVEKGFEWIDKGISLHPKRLDMRFGKVYMFGQVADYKRFTSEIIKAIEFAAKIDNKWTWTNNKPVDDPKDFMLAAIQDYQVQLFNTEDDALLPHVKDIAETVLKYHPKHVESMSNLAVVYMIQKDFDKGLEILLKAETLSPKDHIILGNIAHVYSLKGDKTNAIKYYKLMGQYGDEGAKEYAKNKIRALKG